MLELLLNMKLLGIDYGRAKMGLAIATSPLAQPLEVFRYKDVGEALEKIKRISEQNEIEKIVVGVSEGEMGEESRKFGNKLAAEIDIEVDYSDETLTTADAQLLSISAGMSRKKRRRMEDAYAATIMLQGYIDTLS